MTNPQTGRHDPERLQLLLEGRLSANEEAALLAGIEHDETAQQILEDLAAEQQFRQDVRDHLAAGVGLDPVVQQIADRVKSAAAEQEPPNLDFLEPAESAGYIGQFDGYQIIDCIGHGGMGIVLKAFDPALSRIVALKVLSPQLATGVNARQRFLREARAAAAVSHDHVVTIHAVGESRGLPYLVMEFVRGVSLQEKINSKGPLDVREILRIGTQIASGLAAAHAQGLIHRDIKPGNILLENSVERVKITDFGLARAIEDSSITRTGTLVGTPEYMAPEQARGELLDARADLFSLGSVLHAMATGESPFRADSLAGTIRRVCDESPTPVRKLNPGIPAWLEVIVSRLHSKSPDKRYQSATEVAELLGQHLAAVQRGTVPENSSPGGRPGRSGLLWLTILGGTGLLLFGAALGHWLLTDPAADAAPATVAESRESIPASGPLSHPVTLTAPYEPSYPDAPTDRLSVQYAVIAICEQTGMAYDWERSQANTSPLNRRWVRPDLIDVPAGQALTEMLRPLGLTFAVDSGTVYLQRVVKLPSSDQTATENNR